MAFEKPEDFYRIYEEYKAYAPPDLRRKHIRWFDQEFWVPAGCAPTLSVLEIGCGTGQFLCYLARKGVGRFVGIDRDPRVLGFMPPEVASHVRIADVWDYLREARSDPPFDRVAMLDILEHFSPYEGVALLEGVKAILAADGLVTVRVPNMASPWAPQHQYADLTHKTAYAPGGLRQVALAAGYECVAFLPQRRGSRFRRFAEDRLHALLSAVLTETPPLWSANMIGILRPKPPTRGR